jgi:hypothetical protein
MGAQFIVVASAKIGKQSHQPGMCPVGSSPQILSRISGLRSAVVFVDVVFTP